jgi:hypothetical protein
MRATLRPGGHAPVPIQQRRERHHRTGRQTRDLNIPLHRISFERLRHLHLGGPSHQVKQKLSASNQSELTWS